MKFRSASVSDVCSTVSGMPSSILVSRSLVQQDKRNARPTTARFLFPRPKKAIKTRSPRLPDYNTLGNCGHRALHGSFMLWAIFFGHSAVSSSSQSLPVAQKGLRSVRTRGGSITKMAPGETRRGPIARRLSGASLSAGQKGEESRARIDYYSASRSRPCARSNHPRRRKSLDHGPLPAMVR
jgi:hypothetical protein